MNEFFFFTIVTKLLFQTRPRAAMNHGGHECRSVSNAWKETGHHQLRHVMSDGSHPSERGTDSSEELTHRTTLERLVVTRHRKAILAHLRNILLVK